MRSLSVFSACSRSTSCCNSLLIASFSRVAPANAAIAMRARSMIGHDSQAKLMPNPNLSRENNAVPRPNVRRRAEYGCSSGTRRRIAHGRQRECWDVRSWCFLPLRCDSRSGDSREGRIPGPAFHQRFVRACERGVVGCDNKRKAPSRSSSSFARRSRPSRRPTARSRPGGAASATWRVRTGRGAPPASRCSHRRRRRSPRQRRSRAGR